MNDAQFLVYMIVNILVAIGTIGAVIVALFGRKIFLPKLEITLADPHGELTTWTKDGKQQSARFYHVKVTNRRRWSTASDVGVHLIAVLEERSDNEFHEDWKGDVQMTWKHRSFYPQPGRVGKPTDYDIVSVNEEGYVSLHPIAAATSLPKVRSGKSRFTIWLQARATESDSPLVKVNISWDGKWEKESELMAKHFIVKLVDWKGWKRRGECCGNQRRR